MIKYRAVAELSFCPMFVKMYLAENRIPSRPCAVPNAYLLSTQTGWTQLLPYFTHIHIVMVNVQFTVQQVHTTLIIPGVPCTGFELQPPSTKYEPETWCACA